MLPLLTLLFACDPLLEPSGEWPVDTDSAADVDTDTDTDPVDTEDTAAPCPEDMALVGTTCMDLYEAPNIAGGSPLVMLTFVEAEAWCGARGKRLCFDDEWQQACEGAAATAYPYGNAHQPGVCNDEETWRVYSQSLQSAWPWGMDVASAGTLDALLDLARAEGATASADHVAELYQGEGGGDNTGCVNEDGVYDLVGNVEEWTRRRDGGTAEFHGNLKGRYWSEARTCQSNLTSHGDHFRFYEIGFRCCQDAL